MEAEEKGESDEEEYVPYVSVKDRKRAVLQKHGNRLGMLMKQEMERPESSGNESDGEVNSELDDNRTAGVGRSLLDQHSELKKKEEGKSFEKYFPVNLEMRLKNLKQQLQLAFFSERSNLF